MDKHVENAKHLIQATYPNIENESRHVIYTELADTKGFWSSMVKVQIEWKPEFSRDRVKNEDIKKPTQLIVKIPIIRKKHEKDTGDLNETLRTFTERESLFYSEFLDYKISGFPFPQMLPNPVWKEDFMQGLVMVDVAADFPSIAVDYIPGFSIAQVETLVKALASLHSFLRRNMPMDIIEKFRISVEFATEFNHFMYEVLKNFAENNEKLRGIFMQNEKTFHKLFQPENSIMATTTYKRHDVPETLVHADLNSTNVLWKVKNETVSSELAAIIDFQAVRTGSVCEDLVRVLTLGLDAATRRNETQRTLDTYYNQLFYLLGDDCPISRSELTLEYNRVFTHGCVFGLFGLSMYFDQYKDDVTLNDERRRECTTAVEDRMLGMMQDMLKIAQDVK